MSNQGPKGTMGLAHSVAVGTSFSSMTNCLSTLEEIYVEWQQFALDVKGKYLSFSPSNMDNFKTSEMFFQA